MIIHGGTAGWVLTALAGAALIPVTLPGVLGRRAKQKRSPAPAHPLGPESERMATWQESAR